MITIKKEGYFGWLPLKLVLIFCLSTEVALLVLRLREGWGGMGWDRMLWCCSITLWTPLPFHVAANWCGLGYFFSPPAAIRIWIIYWTISWTKAGQSQSCLDCKENQKDSDLASPITSYSAWGSSREKTLPLDLHFTSWKTATVYPMQNMLVFAHILSSFFLLIVLKLSLKLPLPFHNPFHRALMFIHYITFLLSTTQVGFTAYSHCSQACINGTLQDKS